MVLLPCLDIWGDAFLHQHHFDSTASPSVIGISGRLIGSATDNAGKDRCSSYVHLATLSYLTTHTNGAIGTDVFGRWRASVKKSSSSKIDGWFEATNTLALSLSALDGGVGDGF